MKRAARFGGGNGEIPPCWFLVSNRVPSSGEGHCLVGSLTGAVASQIVTEARDGPLSPSGNQASSAMA